MAKSNHQEEETKKEEAFAKQDTQTSKIDMSNTPQKEIAATNNKNDYTPLNLKEGASLQQDKLKNLSQDADAFQFEAPTTNEIQSTKQKDFFEFGQTESNIHLNGEEFTYGNSVVDPV